jgi:outer membrane receptor protein involved in Fe transport
VLAVGGPAAPYGAARFDLVEAETVDSFEVGYKAALFDRSLRLDTAVYYYDYDNFQTVEQQGTLFVITNAGKAKAYGFEGQAEWRIMAGLDVYATYAWNQARFDGGAYDGNSFRLSPDHTASIGANWKFDALGGEVSVRPSYSWQSKVFFDDNNDRAVFQQPPAAFLPDNIQDEVQDAYGLVDLRVGYKPDAGSWTVGAFVTNLTDESYIIDAGNTGDSLGLPTFIGGRPRMWGVTMGWTY